MQFEAKAMNIIVAYFENLTHVVGGLEKVICDFSNEFDRRGHHVTIVTFDQSEGRPYYPLTENVQVINLREKNYVRLTGIEKIIRELWRLFGKKAVRQWKWQWKRRHGVTAFQKIVKSSNPDVIVSLEPMTSAEILSEGITVPLISSLQNDPSTQFRYFTALEKQALAGSAAVHVLMPSFAQVVKRFVSQKNVVWIPNVIPQYADPADLGREKEVYRIVNVARLNKKQKQQGILIDAFALLADKYPKWIVEFWGGDTSHYREELEQKIRRYHLENRVFLKGVTQDVEQVYKSADIFAFPSKYEGFGLALGEAMSAGLPAVGFASCPAVNELIRNGENGILCAEGIKEFSTALETLMKSPEKRIQMGLRGKAMMRRYAYNCVWGQWEELLCNIAGNRKQPL